MIDVAGGGPSDGLLPGFVVHFNCCPGCLSSALTLCGRMARDGRETENDRERERRQWTLMIYINIY